MDEGYIKIHRKLINWEWYSNKNDRLVWLHCLLKANWNDGYFEGKKIPRGSFVTSYKNLAKEIGITTQQLRTSLIHLKSTHNITHETNNQFSIITINNYDLYQAINKQDNKRLTNEQQTINNNIRKKEEKEYKETISKDIVKKVFSKPTLSEIIDYCNSRNNNVDAERFYDFYESKNWMIGKNKMKDWKAAVRTWEQREKKDNNLPSWFGKEIVERKRTEDEERQLQELIRGNRR